MSLLLSKMCPNADGAKMLSKEEEKFHSNMFARLLQRNLMKSVYVFKVVVLILESTGYMYRV